MDFITPALLWGLAAAGLPVLIHLTGRARPVIHRFPALRFIRRSRQSSSRALRLRQILLLLLRIAVVVCIILALAQPLGHGAGFFWLALGMGVFLAALAAFALRFREYSIGALALGALLALFYAMPHEPLAGEGLLKGDFVVVLDQSMSMDYIEADGTRFELAKKQATELLDRLAPESRAGLIFASDDPERAQARLSVNHEAIRQKLGAAAVTGRALDLARTLAAADEIIARSPPGTSAEPAVIVFFTDLQRNAYDALRSRSEARSGRVHRLVLVDVSSEDARNSAALSATLPAGTLGADSSATLFTRVRPLEPDRQCLVELYLDDKRIEQRLLDPKGRDVVEAVFQFATGAAGQHAGRLHVAAVDRLTADQDAYFAYVAGAPPRALILENRAPGAKGSAFFLNAALQAGDASEAQASSGLTYSVEAAGELGLAKLSKYKAVVLADCNLSPSSWSALQQWTHDGGGLFVWLGPQSAASTRQYGFQEFANHHGLLPGTIGTLTTAEKTLRIGGVLAESPALAHLTADVTSILRDAQFRRFVKVQPEPRDPNSAVLMDLSNGAPFLLEKSYGRGRVLLYTTDAAMECGDLPKHGEAFVTLVLDGMRTLSGAQEQLKARIGAPFLLTLPSAPLGNQVYWSQPGWSEKVLLRVDPGAASGAPGHNTSASIVVPRMTTAGIHRFEWRAGPARSAFSQWVAVNVDTSESDLSKASHERIKEALPEWRPQIVKRYQDAPFSGAGTGGRHELAGILLVALLGLLIAESFLANRFYGENRLV